MLAGEKLQQRRFSGTVMADQPDRFAGFKIQRQRVQQGKALDDEADALKREHGSGARVGTFRLGGSCRFLINMQCHAQRPIGSRQKI